jgi:hypothetical protein
MVCYLYRNSCKQTQLIIGLQRKILLLVYELFAPENPSVSLPCELCSCIISFRCECHVTGGYPILARSILNNLNLAAVRTRESGISLMS